MLNPLHYLKNSRDKRLKHELHIEENGMVTVREQLPEQLTELSEETTVEHAAETQIGLASWLDRVREILDGAELEQLEKVAHLTLQKS